MKTKSGLGKDRGTKLHFTDPCKNHIKAYQKASRSFFAFLGPFHQITVKTNQNCNKNANLRNELCNGILSKPWEKSMTRGIHLYANVFPMLFRLQMCPPPNMPPCPAMCRPASKLFCLPQNCKVQRKDVDLLLALHTTNEGNHVFNRWSSRQ